jgi:hypothetical protein
MFMGKDADFKKNLDIKGFSKQTGGYGLEYYNPDAILDLDNLRVVCESSSTGDRKIHIGELLQFITFVCENVHDAKEFYLVLFINSESSNGCSANKEAERLRYYFERLSLRPKNIKQIKGIYVVDQKEIDIRNIVIEDFNTKPYYSVL